jgi:hypothetical protein
MTSDRKARPVSSAAVELLLLSPPAQYGCALAACLRGEATMTTPDRSTLPTLQSRRSDEQAWWKDKA